MGIIYVGITHVYMCVHAYIHIYFRLRGGHILLISNILNENNLNFWLVLNVYEKRLCWYVYIYISILSCFFTANTRDVHKSIFILQHEIGTDVFLVNYMFSFVVLTFYEYFHINEWIITQFYNWWMALTTTMYETSRPLWWEASH